MCLRIEGRECEVAERSQPPTGGEGPGQTPPSEAAGGANTASTFIEGF